MAWCSASYCVSLFYNINPEKTMGQYFRNQFRRLTITDGRFTPSHFRWTSPNSFSAHCGQESGWQVHWRRLRRVALISGLKGRSCLLLCYWRLFYWIIDGKIILYGFVEIRKPWNLIKESERLRKQEYHKQFVGKFCIWKHTRRLRSYPVMALWYWNYLVQIT